MKRHILLVSVLIITVCVIVGCAPDSRPEQYDGVDFLEIAGEIRFLELAWSPDGQMLAAKYQIGRRGEIGVAIIDVATGAFHSLIPDQEDVNFAPEWSPDSKSLIVSTYVAQPTEDTPFNILVVDAQNGQVKQGVWFGSMATWSNEPNKVIVIDTDVGHLREQVPILEIDLETGESRQFAQTEAALATVRDDLDVSPDGYLAVMNRDRLEIVDVKSGELVGEIDKWLSNANWSPNGEMLIFTYDPEETGESIYSDHIYLSTPDGSCLSDSLDLESRIWAIDWSPDGEQLVFATFEPGKLYFMDLTRGPGKELIDSFKDNCIIAHTGTPIGSPDSTKIAFSQR